MAISANGRYNSVVRIKSIGIFEKKMKRLFLIIILSFLIILCIILLWLKPKIVIQNEKSFFYENQDSITAVKDESMKSICKQRVLVDVALANKNADIYLDCENQSVVIEVSDFGIRTNYVYISEGYNITDIDECSERNGKLVTELNDDWFLCHGDWN